MKKLLILILMVLIVSSCKREETSLEPDNTIDYFPLQVGNKWVFVSSLDSSIWKYEITDTKIISEHIYFERVLTFSDGTNITDYFRVEKNNVVLINFNGADYTYIDFEKPIGEIWNSYESQYGYINKRNISTQVGAGNFNNVVEVFMDNRSISDIYEFNRYAPGIGSVESMRFGFTLTLNNATINGINYP